MAGFTKTRLRPELPQKMTLSPRTDNPKILKRYLVKCLRAFATP